MAPGLPDATSTQDRRDATDQHAQLLLTIEQAAVRAATLRLVIVLAQLQREATGRLLMARTAQAKADAGRRLAEQLEVDALPLLSSPELLPPILAQAQRAMNATAVFTLGPGNPFIPVTPSPPASALELPSPLAERGPVFTLGPGNPTVPVLTPGPVAEAAVRSAAASAREKIERAAKLLERADTPNAAATAFTVAAQAVASVATGAEFAVNYGGNHASVRIAQATGQNLVWVAERDACVVCLALSGDVIDPMQGESFDEFATFGTSTPPSVWPPGMPLIGPPRHPHCRCFVQVWRGSVMPGFLSWPERLKHEALRSIARGWSLPSESKQARLRAAEKILRDGRAAQLPKSVQAYAQRAVGRGRFETHAVPTYPPVRTNVR